MHRKISVEVKNEREAVAIQAALADPESKALMIVMGSLLPLTKRAQTRTLRFVADQLAEDAES